MVKANMESTATAIGLKEGDKIHCWEPMEGRLVATMLSLKEGKKM